MNMILAGDGHTHIRQRDCLESPMHGEFDVVLAQTPRFHGKRTMAAFVACESRK